MGGMMWCPLGGHKSFECDEYQAHISSAAAKASIIAVIRNQTDVYILVLTGYVKLRHI
jgi:hypothetical protein